VDSSETELNEFSDVLTEEFERIKKEAHDVSKLSDLKQIINQKMELVQGRLKAHVENQSGIINEQKWYIESQRKAILKLRDDANGYKEQVEVAKKKSLYDHLTGVPNRRAFDNEIEELRDSWKNDRNTYLAVIIIDIDHFKSVNDRFGHDVGDHALCYVSERINGFCKNDSGIFFSRYGGEEFAIAIKKDNPRKILSAAKHINELVGNHPLLVDDIKIELTVSAGVCFFSERYDSVISTLKRADRALYRAKENGRNRVWVANKVEGL
jgi:diguanylate cyclase